MKYYLCHIFLFTVLCSKALLVTSQPSFLHPLLLENETVYRDVKKSNTYYYLPRSYSLAKDNEGKPAFSLTKMRYTGSRVANDAGNNRFINLLQFRLTTNPQEMVRINELKTALKRIYPSAKLYQTPIVKMQSQLIFTPVRQQDEINNSIKNIEINQSEPSDEKATPDNTYWTDRTVTLRLSNEDATLIDMALNNNNTVMSFAYALYIAKANTDTVFIQHRNRGFEIAEQLSNLSKNKQNIDSITTVLARADAIPLELDIIKWPEVIRTEDLNERMPPRYPLLHIYCYDFYNELRADLFAKKIEIKATSVNGSDISTSYSFRSSQPDISSKAIHFPYAIRLDKPFSYRITEIDKEGEIKMNDWIVQNNWSQEVDITSRPEEVKQLLTEIENH